MHNYKILLYAYGGLLKPSAPTRYDLTCFFVYGDSPKPLHQVFGEAACTVSTWCRMANGLYTLFILFPGRLQKGRSLGENAHP